MKYKDFGINLAKIRQSKNLSAYAVSLAIGKSTSYIHQVETSKINVSLKSIFEICEFLQIEPQLLFQTEKLEM